MTRGRKILVSVLAATAVAVAAISIWFLLTRETKEVEEVSAIDGEEGATPKSLRLPRPDQPLWIGKITGDYYGLNQKRFVSEYWRTRRLGEPRERPDSSDVATIEPFALAALGWDIESEPGERFAEVVIMERVTRLLRDAKVFTAANPVVLVFPFNSADPTTWTSDDRLPWIGIPVPNGTVVPAPLRLIPFPGGDVIVADPQPRVPGSEGDWTALVERARALGREPAFPLIIRYSGWRRPGEPKLEFQNILLLKPVSQGADASAPP